MPQSKPARQHSVRGREPQGQLSDTACALRAINDAALIQFQMRMEPIQLSVPQSVWLSADGALSFITLSRMNYVGQISVSCQRSHRGISPRQRAE